MKNVIIIGAGGHGEVIADILKCCVKAGQQLNLLGFLDDDYKIHGKILSELPVLGSVETLHEIPHDCVIVAIGNNSIRKTIFKKLNERGVNFISAVHPSAIVASDVKIGRGCMICAGVVVNPGSNVSDNVILNTGCTIDHHNFVGEHAHIAPGVHTGGNVTIGKCTFVGIGSKIIPGKKIGSGCIIGAGTLVTKDFSDHVQIIGFPGRVFKHLNK